MIESLGKYYPPNSDENQLYKFGTKNKEGKLLSPYSLLVVKLRPLKMGVKLLRLDPQKNCVRLIGEVLWALHFDIERDEVLNDKVAFRFRFCGWKALNL